MATSVPRRAPLGGSAVGNAASVTGGAFHHQVAECPPSNGLAPKSTCMNRKLEDAEAELSGPDDLVTIHRFQHLFDGLGHRLRAAEARTPTSAAERPRRAEQVVA